MHAFRRRVSPSLVISCLALAIALGGTSYAAVVLPSNSVGATQIRANAVTGPKVKDGSLQVADLRAGELAKKIVVRTSRDVVGPGISSSEAPVACEPGEVAIGGGAAFESGAGNAIRQSYPIRAQEPFNAPAKDGETPTGWSVQIASGTGGYTTVVYAVCLRP